MKHRHIVENRLANIPIQLNTFHLEFLQTAFEISDEARNRKTQWKLSKLHYHIRLNFVDAAHQFTSYDISLPIFDVINIDETALIATKLNLIESISPLNGG